MRLLRTLPAFALAAACGGLPDPEPIRERVELLRFDDCTALEQYIEDTAVLDMRAQLTQAKEQRQSFARASPVAEDAAAPTGDQANASGPDAYTTTNTQVAGVDEADFVKNDGTRIFVLAGGRLHVNVSWPADQLTTVSSLTIEGWPQEMFLDEHDRVIVFSTVWMDRPGQEDGREGCDFARCGWWFANTTKVTVVDVSDLATPRVVREDYLPGLYAGSRRIGETVRLVLGDAFPWPEGVRLWIDGEDRGLYEDRAVRAAEYDELMDANERIIRAQPISTWLPAARRRVADGPSFDVGYSCGDFHRSDAPSRLGLVTVATLDLSDVDAAIGRTSVVAEAGEIYASASALYVASRHWWWWRADGQQDHTYVHKFDLGDPKRATYVASGGVAGLLVDQFSMDEHRGFLRVATTLATFREELFGGRVETTNRVSVLAERAGALEVVGRSEDLAEGERIFSARFMGDRGFVVTFRQVDPLFTFDLSDPTKPRQVGALKVPGFSTYLHPIDERHLLAIGVHQPEPGANGGVDWDERALKLTVFDVGDLANPKEKFTKLVGTSSAWSEALYDHRAFTWFPEKKLLGIPFWDWSRAWGGYGDFVSDLRVFHVDAATGITAKGALSMSDVYADRYGWTWYWSPGVRRSVMADDFVYAISDAGIRVAKVDALSAPLKTVLFDRYTGE